MEGDSPKYAICNELFDGWHHERICDYVAELGYVGLEVAPLTLGDSIREFSTVDRCEFREVAERAGLAIVGLHWLLAKTAGYYLTSPEVETRRRTADYFGALAELCGDLGGTVMVLGSPQQRNLLPGVSLSQATDYAADTICGCLSTLERAGVCLALEPLGPSEGNFLNTAAEAVELIRRIQSPHVRLHLDVKAMSSERSTMPEIIRGSSRDLVHFHANDPNLRGPGMGDIDFRPIMKALREIDYSGWISVEVFDNSPGIECLATESLQNLRSAWRDL